MEDKKVFVIPFVFQRNKIMWQPCSIMKQSFQPIPTKFIISFKNKSKIDNKDCRIVDGHVF